MQKITSFYRGRERFVVSFVRLPIPRLLTVAEIQAHAALLTVIVVIKFVVITTRCATSRLDLAFLCYLGPASLRERVIGRLVIEFCEDSRDHCLDCRWRSDLRRREIEGLPEITLSWEKAFVEEPISEHR